MKRSLFALAAAVALAGPAFAQSPALDVVLAGGRVLDPETGLDAVRDVGIRGGEIVEISETPLADRLAPGGSLLDVSGLMVAPGFVDLHAHGQSYRSNEFQAHDGVTTALELEAGVPFVADWLASRRGRALIHYGATVSHGGVRALVVPELADEREALARALRSRAGPAELESARAEANYLAVPEEATREVEALLERGLEEGALGIGLPHAYYPGADRREIFRVFQFAASKDVPIFTHVRSMGADAAQEVLADAAATGASLHIVHVNSTSLWDLPLVLEMIEGAARRGIDVTTEAYPYTAASTSLESSIFDDGWQDRLRISYGDIQWQDTGERLTEETFRAYRARGGVVIVHVMKPEWIDLAVETPFVMIASDGMPYAPGAHPRSAGTFSRVLGRYVRERELLGLMEAVGKMTLLPARRLEAVAPMMKRKGRLRVGADADVTVLDFEHIRDTATFEDDLSFSTGVRHVLVDGVFVVRDGETVKGVYPGRPVLGRYRQ